MFPFQILWNKTFAQQQQQQQQKPGKVCRQAERDSYNRTGARLDLWGHCEWRNALTIVLAIRFLAQNKFGLKQTAATDGAETETAAFEALHSGQSRQKKR